LAVFREAKDNSHKRQGLQRLPNLGISGHAAAAKSLIAVRKRLWRGDSLTLARLNDGHGRRVFA
jgi:hypothetical protein